ncbi:MAG: hypothetical protein K6T80_02750 [Firmicutes bacterium]|nr:hypothetical protein [Bacillota bacterium]
MKVPANCKQSLKKPKSLFLVVLLILASFLAGAVVERSSGILQDVTASFPLVQDSVKKFVRDKVVFKLNAWTESRSDSAAPLPAPGGGAGGMIRGP